MDDRRIEKLLSQASQEQLKWLLSYMESRQGLKELKVLIERKIV